MGHSLKELNPRSQNRDLGHPMSCEKLDSHVSESRRGAPTMVVMRSRARVYSAARASAWLGKRPAYLVMPTMVKTLVKWGDRPKAYTFWPELAASMSIWMTRAMPLELM